MKFEVWHRQEPTFMNNDVAELGRTFPEGFVHVADVETAHVGNVFPLTNNIDKPWNKNPGVTMVSARSARSTSVGDVIIHQRDEFGVLGYTIDMIGLREWGLSHREKEGERC